MNGENIIFLEESKHEGPLLSIKIMRAVLISVTEMQHRE